MLSELDREFLNEMIRLQSFDKAITGSILHEAFFNPNVILHEIYSHDPILAEQHKAGIKDRNFDGHIQRIAVSKLLAEFIGGMENLGSFCFSIKNRTQPRLEKDQTLELPGIYLKYAMTKTEHKDFFQNLSSDSINSLDEMLSLPKIDSIKNALSEQTCNAINAEYNSLAIRIKNLKKVYTTPVNNNTKECTDPYAFYIPYGSKSANVEHDLVSVYNRIKHRFLIFTDLKQVRLFEENRPNILFAVFSLKDLETYYKHVYSISHCMKSIAILLLSLNNGGINIDK